MPTTITTFSTAAALVALATVPLFAQARSDQPDLVLESIQDGAAHVRSVFTKAADQMSDADYAFKPTPDVRSFGQLLGHVADTNYWFCATATGEKPPVSNIEKTRTSRADIRTALIESFDYCDRAYAAMTDRAKAETLREFNGKPRPALAVLNFRTYHGLLHWGNAITYMRLRGKVPPAT